MKRTTWNKANSAIFSTSAVNSSKPDPCRQDQPGSTVGNSILLRVFAKKLCMFLFWELVDNKRFKFMILLPPWPPTVVWGGLFLLRGIYHYFSKILVINWSNTIKKITLTRRTIKNMKSNVSLRVILIFHYINLAYKMAQKWPF